MRKQLGRRLITISRGLIDRGRGEQWHFSFIVKRNKVISIGWNNKRKTHAANRRFNYRFDYPHSELVAINGFPYSKDELPYFTLINVRIGRVGDILISRPCPHCYNLLKLLGISSVYYTTNKGEFTNEQL